MIGLVACSASKTKTRAKARELYQGPLFKKQVAWLEARGVAWYILSAKYGLLDPEDMIEPYDQTLAKMSKPEQTLWALKTGASLRKRFPGAVFLALLGKRYRQALAGLPFEAPAEHLGIGRQLAFFGRSK